jgi:hypothetical protein
MCFSLSVSSFSSYKSIKHSYFLLFLFIRTCTFNSKRLYTLKPPTYHNFIIKMSVNSVPLAVSFLILSVTICCQFNVVNSRQINCTQIQQSNSSNFNSEIVRRPISEFHSQSSCRLIITLVKFSVISTMECPLYLPKLEQLPKHELSHCILRSDQSVCDQS